MFAAVCVKATHGDYQNTAQGTDTLNILFSATNHVYYYDSQLRPENCCPNFKSSNARDIEEVVRMFSAEARKKERSLRILVKIQNEKTLNKDLRKVTDFISKQIGYRKATLTEIEVELIRITEDAMKS